MEEIRPVPQLNIVWEGSQFVTSSLALINREHCSNLITSGVANLCIVPYEADRFSPEGNPKFEALQRHDIRFTEPPAQKLPYAWIRHQWPPKNQVPKGAGWIIMQPWEFSAVRQDFIDFFRQANEVWTPSTFSRKAFVDSGLDPDRVHVIPNGIDPRVFTPFGSKASLPTKKRFVFLFVGGTIYRKGIDVLLTAYVRAFTAADDVCLLVKDIGGDSYYKGQTAEQLIAEIRKNPNAPEILYSSSIITEEQLAALYRSADVLVSPYRGEGFSMPTLEAMACGVPVMVTQGGATDDFVDESVGWLIPSHPRSIGTAINADALTHEGFLLEVQPNDLADAMRSVVMEPQHRVAKGIRAALRARSEWTWNAATRRILGRLDALYGTSMEDAAAASLADPTDAIITFGIAEERNAVGRIDDAIAGYHACCSTNDLPAHYQLLGLHRMASYSLLGEDTDLCHEFLSKADAVLSAHPDTVYIRSVRHAMLGEWTESLECLTELLNTWRSTMYRTQIGLTLDQLLSDCARALLAAGGPADAYELYTQSLRLQPDNADACYGSAVCLREMGRHDEARSMLDHAVRLRPGLESLRPEFDHAVA